MNALLRVEKSGLGTSICTVFYGAATCADDKLFITDGPDELQLMQDMAFDYSGLESEKCDCCCRTRTIG